MNTVTLDSAYIVRRLNELPPHSRLRSGYCDALRFLRRQELEADARLTRALDDLEREIAAELDFEFQTTGGIF